MPNWNKKWCGKTEADRRAEALRAAELWLDGLKVQEIAEILGVHQSTASRRLEAGLLIFSPRTWIAPGDPSTREELKARALKFKQLVDQRDQRLKRKRLRAQ